MSTPDLGKCVATYTTSARTFVVLALVMVGAFAVAGLLFTFSVQPHEELGVRVIAIFFGLVASLIGSLCVYGFTKGRKNGLRFHERGLAIHKAGQETRLPWEEIVSYGVGAFLEVETTSGAMFDFGMEGLANGSEVGPRLREEVTLRRAVPLLLQAIREGHTVVFEGAELPPEMPLGASSGALAGGFTVGASGVTPSDSNHAIRWEEITDCGTTTATRYTGKFPETVTLVFIASTRGNYQAAIEPESDREELTALCRALSPRLSQRRS